MKTIYYLIFIILFFQVNNLNAQQWELIRNSQSSISIDPTNENTIITSNYSDIGISFNNGDTWIDREFPYEGYLYLIRIFNGKIFIHPRDLLHSFYFSNDTGKTYKKVTLFWIDNRSGGREEGCGDINDFAFANGKYYVGSDQGVYMSDDDWESWTHITDTLTHILYRPPSVNSIIVRDTNIFIGGFRYGIYYSSNDGVTWERRIGNLADDWFECEVLYDFNNMLLGYFDSDSSFMAYSTNDGMDWNNFNTPIDKLEYPPKMNSCNDRIFLYDKSEMFFTNDTGRTWGKFPNDSLHYSYTFDLNSKYFFNSIQSGLYRAKWENCYFDDETDIVEEQPDKINEFTLSPNPATDYIEISTSAVILNEVKNPVIKIYDVLGVLHLRQSATATSAGQVRLDVSDLAAGVYFVRVGGQVLKFVKI